MDQFLPKFFKEASFRRLAATTIPVTMSVHNYTGYGDETEQVAVRRSDVILNDTRNSITMSWPISSDGTRNTASLDFYDVQAIIDTGVYTAEPDTRDYPLIKLTFSPPSRKLVQDFLNNISRPQPKIIKSRVNVNGLTLDCTIELDPSDDNTVTGSITAGDHLYMALSATELMQLSSGGTITRNGRKISLPPKLAGDLGVQIDMLVEQMHNRQAKLAGSNVNINNIPFEKASAKIFTVPVSGMLSIHEALPPYSEAYSEDGVKTTITLTPAGPYVYAVTADLHVSGMGARTMCYGTYNMAAGHHNSVPNKICNIVKKINLKGSFRVTAEPQWQGQPGPYPSTLYNMFYTCYIPDDIIADMLVSMDEAMESGEI